MHVADVLNPAPKQSPVYAELVEAPAYGWLSTTVGSVETQSIG